MGLFPITFDFRLARLGPDGAAVLVVELEVLFDRTTFGVFAAFLLAVPAAVFVIGVLLVNGVGTDLDFPALGEPSYRSPVLAHRHACRWWWTHRRATRRGAGGAGPGGRRRRGGPRAPWGVMGIGPPAPGIPGPPGGWPITTTLTFVLPLPSFPALPPIFRPGRARETLAGLPPASMPSARAGPSLPSLTAPP